jgi:hypothetical protein
LQWDADVVDIEAEIVGLKTVPRNSTDRTVRPAADKSYRGKTVTLLPTSHTYMVRKKMEKVWNGKTPGGWLTHAAPTERSARMDVEIADDVGFLEKAIT